MRTPRNGERASRSSVSSRARSEVGRQDDVGPDDVRAVACWRDTIAGGCVVTQPSGGGSFAHGSMKTIHSSLCNHVTCATEAGLSQQHLKSIIILNAQGNSLMQTSTEFIK